MNNFDSLIREDLRQFQAYSSARKEASNGSVLLNANESPLENIISLTPLSTLNRYPQPQPKTLIDTLANFYTINSDQILITNGSDIGIDLLIRLFCYAGKDSILICPPTYGMYEVSARLQGANVITVALKKSNGFSLDSKAIEDNWNSSVKLIFLCSPNNPTGNMLDKSKIFGLCKKFLHKSIIVVDEAYIEYAEKESLTKNINDHKNLVILRTFSKALSCAGIRCGTLIANKYLIHWLNKIITPYPISTLTLNAALQVFSKENYSKIQNQTLLIRSERKKLINFFNECSWVTKVWPSEANFILVKVKSLKNILKKCLEHHILIRNMHDKPGLKNCVRISIGLSHENDFLIEILKTGY